MWWGRQVEEGTEKREKEALKQEILHEVKSTGVNPLCLIYVATSALVGGAPVLVSCPYVHFGSV